jgi:hypothetical protein
MMRTKRSRGAFAGFARGGAPAVREATLGRSSAATVRRPLGAAIVLAAIAAGCGGAGETPAPAPGWNRAPDGAKGVSSGSEAERFFPLVDGNAYHYETVALGDEAVSQGGLLMTRVHRSGPTTGELRMPSGTRRIEYVPDGVVSTSKTGERTYVLKMPLSQGNAWPGEHGGQTRITAVGVSITVPAGNYTGCISTEELRGGDAPMRVTTTYCPDVGIVSLEAQGGARVERAQLKQYGPPVDLGPEGLTRSPAQ